MPTATEYEQALARLKQNSRVGLIRVSIPYDACPACLSLQGAYTKEATPLLPPAGCSCTGGSHCYYEPVLVEVYP
jgi:hypothetical protein